MQMFLTQQLENLLCLVLLIFLIDKVNLYFPRAMQKIFSHSLSQKVPDLIHLDENGRGEERERLR